MDVNTFRSILPEFSNTTYYPDVAVQYWLTTALTMLPLNVWTTLLDQGVLYYAAHNLALARGRARSAAGGAAPGTTQGALTSKGVDKVSAGYDANAVTLKDGGLWNQTTYGIQFLQLARMVGAQGITQLSGYALGVDTGVFGPGYVN